MVALAIGSYTREQPTTHDWKPGRYTLKGQQKPRYVTDAALAVEQAWKDYDMTIDLREDHLAVDMEVEAALNKALKAEQHEREMRERWTQELLNA
jgi:hypothetical protein